MVLKDNPEIILPKFLGGSYSHFDRIFLPHNELILSEVKLSDSGNLELIVKPLDGGSEQWTDWLKFKKHDKNKTRILFAWLINQIGDTIDSIFRSEFSFENK
jgi:hypothetical protein